MTRAFDLSDVRGPDEISDGVPVEIADSSNGVHSSDVTEPAPLPPTFDDEPTQPFVRAVPECDER